MSAIGQGGSAGIVVADLTDGRAHAPGDCVDGIGGIKYKFVQYREGAAATPGVAGEVCYYFTLDGYKNHQVTSDLSDSVEIGAGVLTANVNDGEYTWIQIKGPATLSIAPTAGADGDPLTPTGATDGTLDVTTAVTDHVCAFAGDISDREIICDFPF